MSTIVCLRMWSPKGLSNISNNANRLLSTTSMWSPINLKLQVSEASSITPRLLPTRNISLSTTRFKEVFKRDIPDLYTDTLIYPNVLKIMVLMTIKIFLIIGIKAL